MSAADKEDLKAELQEIQETVMQATQENKEVDESFLARRFRIIARMAPAILEVVTATLANPLAGLGVAVKKIAEKVPPPSLLPWEEASRGDGGGLIYACS